MLHDDTIVAVATPPGQGGIGIVRLSGPAALTILERLFVPARAGAWRPYRMRYGTIVEPSGDTVDEALAVFMRGPRSFTAEDVVELSCHGGTLVVTRALELAIHYGARLAAPGEFTLRAFLNGRIDLAQAEATLDVINARTSAGLALAQAQLGGWLSAEVRALRQLLLEPLAYCTVLVDFPEDEVEPQDIAGPLHEAHARLERLVATSDQGVIFRQGARAVLVGLPNVGKSSLLNALLRVDRAIVTPIPGTTRDTLEETADLCGIPVVLTDTAGITETDDPVERIGVARSRAALAAADLVLLVLDATRPVGDGDLALAYELGEKPVLVVWNKLDLLDDRQRSTVGTSSPLPWPYVLVSARTGAGLDDLGQAVARTLVGAAPTGDTHLVSNVRHRDALCRASAHLDDGLAGLDRQVPHDLLAIDLRAALDALGEITGDNAGDDLLDTIFSRFCIGK
jgi:tRNA modification GTPase